MIRTWQIDDANVFRADVSVWGDAVLKINEKLVSKKFNTHKKGQLDFELEDGRKARIAVRRPFVGPQELSVHVDGRLMLENNARRIIRCAACGVTAKPNDRFCSACGQSMPDAETLAHRTNVNKATRAIWWLSALYVLVGGLQFYAARAMTAIALAKLKGYDPNSVFPTPIKGVHYTVAALRSQILWNQWGALVGGLILAAIMVLLALWGRRSPLPAIVIATAIYCVISVVAFVVNPATLAQGLLVKILMVALLFRGIKAALALRSADA